MAGGRRDWIYVVWGFFDSTWLTHMVEPDSQKWVEATLGEKQGYFLNFPMILLFVCLFSSQLFLLKYAILSMFIELRTSVLWRGLNRSSAFGILILSSKETLSADLVSEIYIQMPMKILKNARPKTGPVGFYLI